MIDDMRNRKGPFATYPGGVHPDGFLITFDNGYEVSVAWGKSLHRCG